jgi:uncharacterized OB-fold protein
MSVPFWRLRDRYYSIVGSKCSECSSEYFPPVNICKKCHSTNLKDQPMPRTGALLSYTMQKESLPDFEDQEPMMFGLVKLDNGVKIVAQIVDVSYESLTRGMRLRAIFRRVRTDGDSGQIFYGYKFTPARKETA